MSKKFSLELKVGSFVFIALALLTWFIFSINDSSSFKKGKHYKVVFGFANGLKKSAPVRIAGVDEGIIRDIHLFFDQEENKTKVEIELLIHNDVKIPRDSSVIINQLGLLGEKYIEIFPGQDTRNFLKEEDTLVGRDPIPQEFISQRMMDAAKKIDEILANVKGGHGTVGKLFYDERFYDDLQELTSDLKENPWKLLYRPKVK